MLHGSSPVPALRAPETLQRLAELELTRGELELALAQGALGALGTMPELLLVEHWWGMRTALVEHRRCRQGHFLGMLQTGAGTATRKGCRPGSTVVAESMQETKPVTRC